MDYSTLKTTNLSLENSNYCKEIIKDSTVVLTIKASSPFGVCSRVLWRLDYAK